MTANTTRLTATFFARDTVMVARELVGKTLVRVFPEGHVRRYRITETEAYCGANDLACHASKGRTPRTEVMFGAGGRIYVYLIYGMHWMLNVVTGPEEEPSAVLIRGLAGFDGPGRVGFDGPGRVGRELRLERSFYGEDLETSLRLRIEDAPAGKHIIAAPRIGIGYAGEPWTSMNWRFRET